MSPLLFALAGFLTTAPVEWSAHVEAHRVFVETIDKGWSVADCAAEDALVHEAVLYVACGFDGVIEYALSDGAPRRIATRAVPGRAIALFSRSGVVWVEIERREAHPVGNVAPRTVPSSTTAVTARPTAPGEPIPPRPPSGVEKLAMPEGAVTRVEDLDVFIGIGAAQGLQMGDRIEILSGERATIVGRVEQITDDSAIVGVGLGEPVTEGARVRKADRAPVTRSIVAPPRQWGMFELVGEMQAFLPISTLGLGTLTSLSAAYRFKLPMVVRAQIRPVGLSGSDQGNVFSILGWAAVGLDTQLFELTLGAGGATVNERNFDSVAKSALTLIPTIRVGAHDGLHLAAESGTQVYDDAFNFAFLHASAQIPVGTRFALRLRGGGGRVGHAFGDLGVRYLLSGNGGHDSVFLTGFLGGVRVAFETRCTLLDQTCNTTELAGPSLGVGVEWRP